MSDYLILQDGDTLVFQDGEAFGLVEDDGGGGPGPGPTVPEVSASEPSCSLDRFEWIDPRDGVVWEWPGVHPAGIQGLGLPRPRIVTDALPGDGMYLREAWFDVRDIVIPFAMQDWPAALRARWRAWAARLAAGTRGARPVEGILRVTSVAGDQREIKVVYAGGMEVTQNRNDLMVEAVQFKAHDPFFQDSIDELYVFAPPVVEASFFPIPNPATGSFITLVEGFIAVDATIVNTGDVEAWPVVTIRGPVTGRIAFNNLTTGESLGFTERLVVGESVVIDTRPGIKSVVGDDGESRFGSLSGNLWPLEPGINQVHVELGTVEEGSAIEIRFRRRWLTA